MSKLLPVRVVVTAPDPDPPPAPRHGKVRASKMGKWRAAVLIGVHVLIGLHIAHWLTTGATVTPVEPSEAMAFSRASIVNAGLIFFAVAILLTAIFGRFFCGWGCHVLALQDFCRWLMLKVGITPRPLRTRTLVWVPTLAFFYMFVWPAVYRLWIGDSFALRGSELVTTQFWATFPGWVVGGLTFLTCGFASVYFLGAKGFCTYGCPYGAIFAAVDRVSPLRIRVTDACEQCGHCTAVCSSNVRVHEEVRDWKMVVSPGCMKCMDCVSVCPKGALYYGAGPIALTATPRSEPPTRTSTAFNWRDEAILVSAFVASFVSVRGLYGVVPFLMALGFAGVCAYLALTSVKLATERTVERSGLRLKRAGTLLPQGRTFIVAMVALAGFVLHSAGMQWQLHQAVRAYDATARARLALPATPGIRTALTPELTVTTDAGIAHFETLDRWGLFPTLGNAARQAWLHALKGSADSAETFARLALERGELPAEMQLVLAHVAALRGDRTAATAAWTAAIAERPDLPDAYLALGIYLAQAGELTSAREVFDRGRAAVPDSAELFYNAALVRAMSGESEAAVALFERSLKLNPRYVEARENLAGVLANLGRFAASVEQFRIAVAQSPDDAQTRVLLARALIGLGDATQAKLELEHALQLDANNGEARELLRDLSGRDAPESLLSAPSS
jgi:polyferredoxin/tetratricopeptide (TPR) repeat protein